MNNNLEFWLQSTLPNVTSPLDSFNVTSFHEIFNGFNGFSMHNFYDTENNDIDLKLTKKPITVNMKDIQSNYENDYFDNSRSDYDVVFELNDFVDFVLEDGNLSEEKQNDLMKSIEVYETNKPNKYNDVFIPPGIVLSHTNLLFKMIIKCVIDNNFIITLPEIKSKLNGTNCVITSSQIIFTPKDKLSFYQFCYQNTTKQQNNKIERTLRKCCAPPILTKQDFGRLQLKNALRMQKKIKQQKNLENDKLVISNLSYEETKSCLDLTNEQIGKFKHFVGVIWENVLIEYLDVNNYEKCVLDKLCKLSGHPDNKNLYSFIQLSENDKISNLSDNSESSSSENEVFNKDSLLKKNSGEVLKYFESLPLFVKLLNLRKRLKATINQHKKLYFKQKGNKSKPVDQHVKKIDTRYLAGKFDI